MATFVVHLRISPSEYKALTLAERDAIVREHNKANRRRGR